MDYDQQFNFNQMMFYQPQPNELPNELQETENTQTRPSKKVKTENEFDFGEGSWDQNNMIESKFEKKTPN